MKHGIIILFLTLCNMAAAEEPIQITYVCVIPAGLNREIIFHHKDGTQEKRDAHSIYKADHKIGWSMLIKSYLKTGSTTVEYFARVVPW